jgi:hypothetical protein
MLAGKICLALCHNQNFGSEDLGAMPTALRGHGHANPWQWHPTLKISSNNPPAMARHHWGRGGNDPSCHWNS